MIFENYGLFLKEHQDSFTNNMDAVRLLNDDGMSRAYFEAITESLSPSTRPAVLRILEQQRMNILQESANVGASGFAAGWTVMQTKYSWN